MDITKAAQEQTHIDAMIVLGHHVNMNGELSDRGRKRSEAAAYISGLLHPKIVIFSGGRDLQQVRAGEFPPISEATAMYRYAEEYSKEKFGNPLPIDIGIFSEEISDSTTANLVHSSKRLDLQPGDTLALLTDDLHNLYDRVQFLGKLVFPKYEILPLTFRSIITQNEKDEERRKAFATRFIMFGIRAGNTTAIMKRQRALEATYYKIRTIGESFLTIPPENAANQPTNEISGDS